MADNFLRARPQAGSQAALGGYPCHLTKLTGSLAGESSDYPARMD